MKKVFSLLAVALMAATASAQIVSSNSRNETNEPGECPAYNRLSLNYQQIKASSHGISTDGINGVNVEFLHGFNVLKSQPLYVETGISATYANNEEIAKAIRIGVPVNLAYKYTFQSANVWVQPYAGLDLICNAYVSTYLDEEKDIDTNYKRVQGGWHIGANIGYKRVNLGLKYGSDFTNLIGESLFFSAVQTKSFTIGLGYNF